MIEYSILFKIKLTCGKVLYENYLLIHENTFIGKNLIQPLIKRITKRESCNCSNNYIQSLIFHLAPQCVTKYRLKFEIFGFFSSKSILDSIFNDNRFQCIFNTIKEHTLHYKGIQLCCRVK